MSLICQNCGEALNIHLLSPEKESEQLYCSWCGSYQEGAGGSQEACPDCHSRYSDFLRMGRLGCASCYQSFAPHLEALMENYHRVTPGAKAFAPAYDPQPIALARSQEICEYVLAPPGSWPPTKTSKSQKFYKYLGKHRRPLLHKKKTSAI